MHVVEPEPAETAAPGARFRRRARRYRLPPALLLGLVAILCSVVLPLAPVQMSSPTVSWPQDPLRPVPTMLELTDQQPLALDITVSCAAVRAAAASADGVVLATLVPTQPAAREDGLLLTARDGELSVLNRGRLLLEEPVPDGSCGYRLAGSAEELTVSRDGDVLAVDRGTGPAATEATGGVEPGADGDVLPDVDVLTTSVPLLPDGGIRVELAVDNQFNTVPGTAKKMLLVVLLLSTVGSLVALARAEWPGRVRGGPSADLVPASRRSRLAASAVDVAVVGTLLLWVFLAPQSDDDGYYAAMARNAEEEGYVGNYYQLLNQPFTPFTWFYRLLGWWQQVGDSPVVLRVPALVVGLATWVVLRRFLAQPGARPSPGTAGRWAGPWSVVVLGAAFLAWWLPYGMGVRPEAVVGLLAVAALLGVAAGLRRQRLLPVALAFGCAGLAVACHPTGLVALAPFLVALPRLSGLIGAGSWRDRATRVVLVLAPGSLAAAAAFGDGSLHDFVRGQEIFLSIAPQNSWYDEYQRYTFLLSPGPMGSYAKRAAVLLALVALAWCLVLAVGARARGARLPLPLVLSAQSLAMAFLLLWLTPSKWTHHFGALAGLGPAFLALLLVSGPALAGLATGGRSPARSTRLALLASGVLVFALSFQGPNQWAYSWLPGMPHAGVPPFLGPIRFGSPLTWLAVAGAVVGAVVLVRRRTARSGPSPVLTALPLVALLFLLVSAGHLVGSFGYAAVRTGDGYSPWADALTDPLAKGCGAAGGLSVLDLDAARPAAVAGPAPAPEPGSPFVEGSGWATTDPPPAPVGEGIARHVWGSLSGDDPEAGTGTVVTPWFALPPEGEGERLAVLAAGRLGGGNVLRVEYAAEGTGPEPTAVWAGVLADGADSPAWRTLVLDAGPAREAGADLLRIVAEDRSGGVGGWLAFTGPSTMPWTPLPEVLDGPSAVAVAWQIAFFFPCQRQPTVRFGITEPVSAGVVWTDAPEGSGLGDSTWQVHRGGLFAPVTRTSGVTRLAAVFPGSPEVGNVQVYLFDLPYARSAYDLQVERVQRWGWEGLPEG